MWIHCVGIRTSRYQVLRTSRYQVSPTARAPTAFDMVGMLTSRANSHTHAHTATHGLGFRSLTCTPRERAIELIRIIGFRVEVLTCTPRECAPQNTSALYSTYATHTHKHTHTHTHTHTHQALLNILLRECPSSLPQCAVVTYSNHCVPCTLKSLSALCEYLGASLVLTMPSAVILGGWPGF